MKSMKYLLCLVFFTLINYESQAQLVSIRIGRPSPPPPPRSAYRPVCPGPDYIWHDGRWSWDDYVRDYVWQAGFWEYVQPRYVRQVYYRDEPRGRAYGHRKNHRRCD